MTQTAADFRLTAPRASRKKAVLVEQELHIAVADYLRLSLPRHWLFLHVANEGIRSKAAAGILKRMGFLSGAADIFIAGDGRLYCLEIKAPDGDVSPAQIDFQASCHRAGVPYAVCRSQDEVEAALRSWGIPLRGRVAA
jgi:hypothetical protein